MAAISLSYMEYRARVSLVAAQFVLHMHFAAILWCATLADDECAMVFHSVNAAIKSKLQKLLLGVRIFLGKRHDPRATLCMPKPLLRAISSTFAWQMSTT